MQILKLRQPMSNFPTNMPRLRYLCLGLVLLVLIAGFAFALKPQQTALAQAPSVGPNEPPFLPQRVYLPHWSNEEGFSTTVFIRNVNIKYAVNAKLSLILNHRTLTLASINIPALQTVPVDIAQALIAQGEQDKQSGGAVIDFDASSAGSVNAYAQVLDTSKSLSLSLPFMESATSVAGPLEAVAFCYSKKTDGYVALQNTTDAAVTVTPTAIYASQTVNLGQQQIPARQRLTVKLPTAPGTTGNSGAFSVGLRVASSGSAGSIVAQGWAVEKNAGFAVPFAFHTPGGCNCTGETQHLYGAGVAIGAGAMMGMTPNAIFSPYLAVRNRSNNTLSVTPIFSYETAQGTRKVTLPTLNLNAQANTLVNLKTYQDQGLIAQNAGDGNIDLQYQGEAGALVAELSSVDQYGSFVSPVPLTCNGNRSLHQSYWRTDGDWHSMLTLQNIASEENDVEVTVSYPGGVYVVNKKIAAGATVMLSVNEWQQTQTPDANGQRIPLTAKTGGINVWSRNQNAGLVMNAMLMNPTTKTCGSCNGTGYVNWQYLSDVYGGNSSGFSPHEVGGSIPINMHLHWTTSNYSNDNPSLDSTSNSAVVDSSLNAVGAGTTTLFARSGQNYPTNIACSTYQQLTAFAQAKVFEIKIFRDSQNVTGTTLDVIVGQRINLQAVLTAPPELGSSETSWTVPGFRIANYVDDETNAVMTSLDNLSNNTTITYCWLDGGDNRVVKFDLSFPSSPFLPPLVLTTKSVTFNVKRPTAQVTAVTGTPQIISGPLLSFGNSTTPGIRFTKSVTIPSGFSPGEQKWVQRISSTLSRRKATFSGQWQKIEAMNVLDTTNPYDPGDSVLDVPQVELLPGFGEFSVDETFEMYLMFKPAGNGSIWVPLRKVTWYWKAGATWNAFTGNWILGTNPSFSSNPATENATTPPQWAGNIALGNLGDWRNE